MKKLFICFYLFISLSATSQESWRNTFSIEPFIGWGEEMIVGLWGIEYGTRVNYSIFDRFGLSASLGSFQSLTKSWNGWKAKNTSEMLASAGIYVDILKCKDRHRLRLATGATYFWITALTHYFNKNIHPDIPQEVVYIHRLYKKFGTNLRLSYLYQFSDKWFLGVNLQGYELFNNNNDGLFTDNVTLGMSVGYNF